MSKVERFEGLKCWQEAREFVKTAYKLSEASKFSKDFDLKSQFRKAALSVMNNIAEGFTRFSDKEFIRFLDYAVSSAGEVKSMTYVLEDLNYLKNKQIENLHGKIDKTKILTLALLKYL